MRGQLSNCDFVFTVDLDFFGNALNHFDGYLGRICANFAAHSKLTWAYLG